MLMQAVAGSCINSQLTLRYLLEEWMAIAIGDLPPSYSSEEYEDALAFFWACLDSLNKRSIKASEINEEIRSHLQGPDHEYQQKQIDSIIKVIPDIIKKLESLKLIERYGDSIRSIQIEKIKDLTGQIVFIKKSVERMIVWTCYYLYHQGKYAFSAQDILEYNPKLSKDQIEKVLDKKIIPQCQRKEMKFNREGNNYILDKGQNNKLIRKCMTGMMESHSRRKSQDLKWKILDLLDRTPYSNSDLARILDVDKSHISRKIKYLRDETKFVKPADFIISSEGHQYWLTNCNNCPWNFTKEECRNKSITNLTEICKQRYDLDLDPSYLDQIEYNQTLVHLVDLFRGIPNQNSIEKEKRVFLKRVLQDIINKIGRKNLEITDNEYWRKTNKGRQQLNLPYLLELYLHKHPIS